MNFPEPLLFFKCIYTWVFCFMACWKAGVAFVVVLCWPHNFPQLPYRKAKYNCKLFSSERLKQWKRTRPWFPHWVWWALLRWASFSSDCAATVCRCGLMVAASLTTQGAPLPTFVWCGLSATYGSEHSTSFSRLVLQFSLCSTLHCSAAVEQ